MQYCSYVDLRAVHEHNISQRCVNAKSGGAVWVLTVSQSFRGMLVGKMGGGGELGRGSDNICI
jgi:hypothetical protein